MSYDLDIGEGEQPTSDAELRQKIIDIGGLDSPHPHSRGQGRGGCPVRGWLGEGIRVGLPRLSDRTTPTVGWCRG